MHPTNDAAEYFPLVAGESVGVDELLRRSRSFGGQHPQQRAGTRRWVHERGFKSLIVVTSNYHMPRAIVELSHAMPDIRLIPFVVVGDKWRDEPWWTSGAVFRLLLSEYVKYVAAGMRVHLADLGLDLTPEAGDMPTAPFAPDRPATAQAN